GALEAPARSGVGGTRDPVLEGRGGGGDARHTGLRSTRITLVRRVKRKIAEARSVKAERMAKVQTGPRVEMDTGGNMRSGRGGDLSGSSECIVQIQKTAAG